MMDSLREEVAWAARGYLRKGGKQNRGQQFRRMCQFARFCEREGMRSLAQVGARQVIRYWRSEAMLDLSDSTRQSHYYALCTLWKLSGKPTSPPMPFTREQRARNKRAVMTQ